MNENISKIQSQIEPLRQEIINHKVYGLIRDLDDLKMFMQFHIYAVWDFMSLLKALQNQLTCVSIPWYPTSDADSRYLINEIVVGEESDVDENGIRKSHFELYLDAMNQAGASTDEIHIFLENLKREGQLAPAFLAANTPAAAQSFVNFTFDIIQSGKAHLQAAIFTFGREDLIPSMFYSIINDIHLSVPDKISIFKYYLERHIEVDGDHHSHLALEMTNNLCGDNLNYWEEAQEATIQSLKKRIELWDGVYEAIKQKKS
jgi:hypothetical protein